MTRRPRCTSRHKPGFWWFRNERAPEPEAKKADGRSGQNPIARKPNTKNTAIARQRPPDSGRDLPRACRVTTRKFFQVFPIVGRGFPWNFLLIDAYLGA